MGSCWNTPLPPEGDLKSRLASYGIQSSLPKPPSSNKSPGAAFSKEETKLRDLLSALRTGLLFSPTQFTVLPGVATTGRVTFALGNTELHKLVTEDDDEGEELPEAVVLHGEDSETTPPPVDDRYSFQITFKGKSWSNDLTMRLVVWAALGPHAGHKVVFQWSGGTLRVEGCEGLNAHSLPVGFDDETEFCKCCLSLLYQSTSTQELVDEDDNSSESNETVTSLKTLAYKTAVCNLDLISDLYAIPSKLYFQLFGSQLPVVLAVRLWPGKVASQFSANTTLRVKAHMLFAEFLYVLREHFSIPANHTLKLYHNFRPVAGTELVTERHHQLDCFVIAHREECVGGSYASLEEEGGCEAGDGCEEVVVSLMGRCMQNMKVDLEMPMREFDSHLRSHLSLRKDSFLVIVSEDDFSPQYTSNDSWRCTYPFSVPDTSLSAGLRRSFRKLSEKRAGASRLTQSQRFTRSEQSEPTLAPHMSAVVRLLSSTHRQFPSNADRYSLTVKELYSSMPLYQLSLSQCGLHPYAIVQVFEVTGPPIPITVRLLTNSTHNTRPGDRPHPQTTTSLANIMDINPEWSVSTFLQYVDTIISPGTGNRRTALRLSHHHLDESCDQETWKQTIGVLLDTWGPSWWGVGAERTRPQLTPRDIDPTEFLLIEKY